MYSPTGIRTEILLRDNTWYNVSSNVRGEGAGEGIRITAGGKNERARTNLSATFTMSDEDGVFNDTNPRSPLFGLIGRNTQCRVQCGNRAPLEDNFNRSVSNQWTGGAFTWTITTSAGAANNDFDINGTHGTQSHPTDNVLHYSTSDTGEKNHRVRARFKLDQGTITGANVSTWILGRFTDISNYYVVIVSMSTAGNVQMQIQKRVSGSLTAVSSAITTHSGYSGLFNSVEFMCEFYIEGPRLYCKMWDTTNFSEMNEWQIIEEDFSLSTGNQAGVASRREGSNTNANLQFQFNEFFCMPGTIRGHFEIPNFGALEWQPGGTDLKQTIQATGLKRRLGASGAPVLKSPVYRKITSSTANIVAYWPCEDGIHTTQIGSGLNNGIPLNVIGTDVAFGSASELPGIASMVAIGDLVSLRANVIQSTDTGSIRAAMFMQFPPAGTLPDNACLMEVAQVKDPNIRKWRLIYGTGGSLKLFGYTHGGSLVEDSGPFAFGVDGAACMVEFQVVQNGADVDWRIGQQEIRQDGSVLGTAATGTFTANTVGAISGMAIGPSGDLGGCSFSHIVLANSASVLDNIQEPMGGYYGETTAQRFVRLMDEEGISYHIIGTAGVSTSARMGAQRIATLLQNLEDIEDTERGIIFEARQFFGFIFRQHHTLYNQPSIVGLPALDYEDSHLSGEPFPVPDDLEVGNDVVATRALGGEYRSVEEVGAMSVLEYPDGIGRYDLPINTRVMQDSQLPNIARWDRHIGTWPGPRFPEIEFQMHRTAISSNTALTNSIAQMQIGDYFAIDNPPLWLPPEKIEQLSRGYTEVIRNTHWTFTHLAVPAMPYRIAVRDSNVGGISFHRDSLDSEVDSTYTIGQTTLNVQVNTNPAWVTGSVDFNVMVAGVLLHVTSIGAVVGNVQAFTVDATPVNGITNPKGGTTIAAGEPVHVYPQARRGLQRIAGNTSNISDFGTEVTGVDTPPTQWIEGENTGVFTNTAFAQDTIPLGLIFTAPSTGRVLVTYSGRLINDTGAVETLMGITVRLGSVIGDGTSFEAVSDGRCLRVIGTDHKQISLTRVIDGLTAGRDYNIVFAHRRSGGNAQVNERFLLVRPDRTQGGRPGSIVEEVPESTFSEQGASDTTTSTTYTTADMTPAGENFIAPASGKVLVHIAAQMDNGAGNTIFVSYRIGTGGTVGAGTEIVAPNDTRAIALLQVNNIELGGSFLVTGLVAGDQYNAQMMHRVTAGTGTLVDRRIAVEQVF